MSEPIDPIQGVQPRMREALEFVRPRMSAIDRADLLSVNVEPFVAAAQVRGSLPELLLLRADLIRTFNQFEIVNLDLLEIYALALLQAETVHRAVNAKAEENERLLREAFKLRARLVTDASVLTERGLIVLPQLSTLSVPNGYRNIGADLLSLSTVLRQAWSSIVGKSPIQQAELELAEMLGERLLCAIASRQRRTVAAQTAADDRQRAFTLMVKAYDEVRRAVLYLRRHEGDADRIAPSLYRKGRVARPRNSASQRVERADTTTADPSGAGARGSSEECPMPQTKITDPFVH